MSLKYVPTDRCRAMWNTMIEVSRGEKMFYSGTDPEPYITEYTLVYEDKTSHIQKLDMVFAMPHGGLPGFGPSNCEGYVTNFAPHRVSMLIA